MRATLDAIVTKFKYPNARKSAEPTYTLELTGPGIFTDAVKATYERLAGPLDPPAIRAAAAAAAT